MENFKFWLFVCVLGAPKLWHGFGQPSGLYAHLFIVIGIYKMHTMDVYTHKHMEGQAYTRTYASFQWQCV